MTEVLLLSFAIYNLIMKPFFVFLSAISLLFAGCVDYPLLVRGKYIEGPYVFSTRRPYDSVWHDVTAYFNVNNLPLRVADSLNGRIGTYYISRKDKISYEYKHELVDKNAWLVLGAAGNPVTTSLAWQWEVLINRTDSGILVSIKPVNVTAYKAMKGGNGYQYNWLSSGVFEKELENNVK